VETGNPRARGDGRPPGLPLHRRNPSAKWRTGSPSRPDWARCKCAEHSQADVWQVLGAAIAHEVGHLLLGSAAHSGQGVMRATWEKEQLELASIGELVFTTEQAAKIRSAVTSLMRSGGRGLSN